YGVHLVAPLRQVVAERGGPPGRGQTAKQLVWIGEARMRLLDGAAELGEGARRLARRTGHARVGRPVAEMGRPGDSESAKRCVGGGGEVLAGVWQRDRVPLVRSADHAE